MHSNEVKGKISLDPDILTRIAGTSLFYPCCGRDLLLPVNLFASTISDFYFVDIRQQRRPALPTNFEQKTTAREDRGVSDTIINSVNSHEFRLHRWKCRAETVLPKLPSLGVFFFRGDTLADGEGSSGIPWLGRDLFSQILDLLVPGGIVVTDGSNLGPNGPKQLSRFYWNREIEERAVTESAQFSYLKREFTCIGYAGEKYGPTLIWQVS